MKKGTILLVDDDNAFRESLRDVITDWSYECLSVPGAREALESLKKELIDLALLDIRMPGMSGVECLKEIRRLYPHVKVVMMTAYSEQTEQAIDLGAITVLSKPLDINSLLTLLQTNVKRNQ